MKKFILFFITGLSFVSASLSYADYNWKPHIAALKKHRRFLTGYIPALLISGGIGAATGGTLRYLEKRLNVETNQLALFITLLGWIFESEIRNDIIIALQRDFSEYGVAYRQGLMFKSAWIASWIAYLQA